MGMDAYAERARRELRATGETARKRQVETRGELTAQEAAGAKMWATETQWEIIDRCLQLHGGYGYINEFEIARLWRDARVQRLYGGTTEIMRDLIGRSLGF